MTRIGPAALGLLLAALIGLAGCQSGIGPDQERPRATIHAYETEVADLQRETRQQRATLAALTPPPPTPTPVPFVEQWQIEPAGPAELHAQVGLRDGLTPLAASGVFLVVPITVTNQSPTPAAFNAAHTLLVADDEGKLFDLDPRATGAAYLLDFDYKPSFAPRQPGIPYPDVLVFDVDPAAGGFTLESFDGSFVAALDV